MAIAALTDLFRALAPIATEHRARLELVTRDDLLTIQRRDGHRLIIAHSVTFCAALRREQLGGGLEVLDDTAMWDAQTTKHAAAAAAAWITRRPPNRDALQWEPTAAAAIAAVLADGLEDEHTHEVRFVHVDTTEVRLFALAASPLRALALALASLGWSQSQVAAVSVWRDGKCLESHGVLPMAFVSVFDLLEAYRAGEAALRAFALERLGLATSTDELEEVWPLWVEQVAAGDTDGRFNEACRVPGAGLIPVPWQSILAPHLDLDHGDLHDYRTGDRLRRATLEEQRASLEAARHDGGRGVFELDDGRHVYVDGGAQ